MFDLVYDSSWPGKRKDWYTYVVPKQRQKKGESARVPRQRTIHSHTGKAVETTYNNIIRRSDRERQHRTNAKDVFDENHDASVERLRISSWFFQKRFL